MNEIENTHRECSRPWELFTIDLGHCININKNNRTQKFHSGLSVTKAKIRYTFVPALSEEEGGYYTFRPPKTQIRPDEFGPAGPIQHREAVDEIGPAGPKPGVTWPYLEGTFIL